MSPYATTLAHARLDALRKLIDALKDADTPEEKRRCAVAIFNAPDPCDLDDEIELDDDNGNEDDNGTQDDEHPDTLGEEADAADKLDDKPTPESDPQEQTAPRDRFSRSGSHAPTHSDHTPDISAAPP